MQIAKTIIAMFATVVVSSFSSSAWADDSKVNYDPAELTNNHVFHVSANWTQLARGWKGLSVKITDMENKPVSGAKVTVVYEMTSMPMSPPDKPVVEIGDGVYQKQLFLGMRGKWSFNIKIDGGIAADELIHYHDVTN